MATIDTTPVPRHPGGAVGGVGGQFTHKVNLPPEGSLTESATGSFLYPPENLRTAGEMISFLESAPISDQVLSNATYAYTAWRKKAMLAHIHARHTQFMNDPDSLAGRMAARHGQLGLDRALDEERPKWIAEAEAMYPVTRLPRTLARNVLRAHQIVLLRGMLRDEDEKQKALDHLISHDDRMVRADDLVTYYNTMEWAKDALTESDYAQAETMNRVALLLAEQQGITDYDDWH